jgi:non-ribosomal peptide synthetase component E (peptide arylation enzyme)
MQYKAIERATALPVLESRLGEKVCLAVMTRAGTRVSGKEILDHLNALGLPRYDTPEYFLALRKRWRG